MVPGFDAKTKRYCSNAIASSFTMLNYCFKSNSLGFLPYFFPLHATRRSSEICTMTWPTATFRPNISSRMSCSSQLRHRFFLLILRCPWLALRYRVLITINFIPLALLSRTHQSRYCLSRRPPPAYISSAYLNYDERLSGCIYDITPFHPRGLFLDSKSLRHISPTSNHHNITFSSGLVPTQRNIPFY